MRRALALVGLLIASPALAQPGAPAPAPAPPSAPVPEPAPAPTPPPAPDTIIDPTTAAYDAAMNALIVGDFATAARGFDAVAAASPDPERRGAARALAGLARTWIDGGVRLASAGHVDALADAAAEHRTGGRVSFIATNTIWGLYGGVVLADLADLEDARAWAGTLFLSTGAGLLGSYAVTRGRKMTSAMAEGYWFGLMLGVGNALLLGEPLGLYDGDSETSEKVQSAVFLSGSALALAGLVYGDQGGPTAGQIAFAETVSLLGLASTWLGMAILQPDDLDGSSALTVTALGLDASAIGGLAIARNLDWSSGRSRIASLGALLGGLGGVTAGVIAGGEDPSARTLATLTLVGMWGGFGLTAHLTRGMKPDRGLAPPPRQVQVVPTVHDGGAGLSLAGAW